MPWKTPAELSDDDMRAMLANVLLRQQEMETIVAQTIMVLLSSVDEVPEPTEGEYRHTVDQLVEFLAHAYDRLQQINDATDQFQAEQASRN